MLQHTGLGCDVCGFGTIENIEDFNPFEPCPDCGEVMLKNMHPNIEIETSAFGVSLYIHNFYENQGIHLGFASKEHAKRWLQEAIKELNN